MGRRPAETHFEESEGDAFLMDQAFQQLRERPAEAEPPAPPTLPPSPKPKSKRRVAAPERPDDEIDLHGKTREEAIHMVQNFILSSHRAGFRHVLIITGRGKRSAQGPILKKAVEQWLERNGTPYLHEFADAPPGLGGAGALLVFLKN
jgi:DNA-nicking Smr family endonuclease